MKTKIFNIVISCFFISILLSCNSNNEEVNDLKEALDNCEQNKEEQSKGLETVLIEMTKLSSLSDSLFVKQRMIDSLRQTILLRGRAVGNEEAMLQSLLSEVQAQMAYLNDTLKNQLKDLGITQINSDSGLIAFMLNVIEEKDREVKALTNRVDELNKLVGNLKIVVFNQTNIITNKEDSLKNAIKTIDLEQQKLSISITKTVFLNNNGNKADLDSRVKKITFTCLIQNNIYANSGTRTVYLRIYDMSSPTQHVLNPQNNFFVYNNQQLAYTVSKTVQYTNNSTNSFEISWQLANMQLDKNKTYGAELFIENERFEYQFEFKK